LSATDAHGHRMSPTHANKKGVRYRYYVSSHLQDGSTQINTGQGQRIPAAQLEQLIVRRLLQQLTDVTFVLDCVGSDPSTDAAAQKRLIEQARRVAEGGDDLPSPEVRVLISAILLRAQVHPDRIELTVSRVRLAQWLEGRHKDKARRLATTPDTDARPITVSIPARLKRAGKEMRIIVEDGSDPVIPDTSLVRLLVRAHVIRERLINDRSLTLEEIAKSEEVVPSYATRLYRLTLLAPDIVGAILAGKHPPELTARRLMDDTRLPLAWHEQRHQLGFGAI
jgi:site-specific DNA recombinase